MALLMDDHQASIWDLPANSEVAKLPILLGRDLGPFDLPKRTSRAGILDLGYQLPPRYAALAIVSHDSAQVRHSAAHLAMAGSDRSIRSQSAAHSRQISAQRPHTWAWKAD